MVQYNALVWFVKYIRDARTDIYEQKGKASDSNHAPHPHSTPEEASRTQYMVTKGLEGGHMVC